MTTSILPLRLGTARLGQYVEPGAEAPKRITVHGECWELVTDPLLDIALVTEDGDAAAQEAFAARLANILHLNVGNLIVTEGAVVNELVAQRIAVAVARVIELDADRITSGIVDTSHLNAGAIAAAVATVIELNASRITSGTINTARLNTREIAAAVANVIELNASRITSGIISTARLDASAIASAVATIIELNADRITSGTLDADRIAAHSITAAKILVDEELAAELVSAMTVATKRLIVTEDAILNRATIINGLAADVVSAATIYASQLVVTALDEHGDIVPGAVDTVQIADGAVRAAQIHAEEVAGVVARFLTIEVGQLVAGTADIDTLVAQKIAGATADFQEAFIQNLRSNGAVIDEAVIGELASNIITSGLFRTAAAGQRVVIDASGLVMYGADVDGNEFELVRIGPSGDNLITAGETTVSDAGVQAASGTFGELSVGGEDLGTILSALPRGMRAWGPLADNSKFDSDTSQFARRAELQTTLLPDRLYRVQLSSHILEVDGSANATVIQQLRYSLDQTNITTGISPDSSREEYVGTWLRQHVQSGAPRSVPGMEFLLNTDGWDSERHFWLMFLLRPEQADRAVRVVARWDYPVTMSVEDMGPSQAGTLKRWNDGSGVGSQDPEPTKRRYTKTYSSNGYRCYNLDGSDAGRPDVVQGLYSGGPSRFRRRGGWTFPNMSNDLSGATVEKIEMYIYCNHTHASAGSTVRPAVWGPVMSSSLSAFTTINGWKRNTGRWITLPKSLYNGFKNGTHAGVGVTPSSNSATQFARFNPTGAKIRITYVK